MDSNAERAQHGDLVEITHPARVDFGKRMQVATSDEKSIVVLDNRVRVTVNHGEYKVVRRCGRPATADAVGAAPAKRGRPTNAERAARAAEQTPAAVEVPRAPVTPKITEDEAVARLEAAVYDVPVTRKPALAVDESKVTVAQANDFSVEAATAFGMPAVACAEHKAEQNARNEQAQALAARAEGLNTPAKAGAEDRAKLAEAEKAEPGTLETAKNATTELEQQTGVERPHASDFKDFHAARLPAEAHGDTHDHMVDAVVLGLGAQRSEYSNPFVIRAVDVERLLGSSTTKPEGIVPAPRKHPHYFKAIPCNQIDVYRVLHAFGVTDPCVQHALKKLLVAGGRGSKDIAKDVQEAIDSLVRWQEMRAEEAAA